MRLSCCKGIWQAFVLKQIQRARLKSRKGTLTPHPKTSDNRIPMVVTYHPGLPDIDGILRHLQPLLHCSDKFKKAIKEVPLVSFRRPKSLGDYPVHSKLKRADRTEPRTMGTVRCGTGRCQVYQHLEPGTLLFHTLLAKSSIQFTMSWTVTVAMWSI